MMVKCNKTRHKLIVTHYSSGDDRDYWIVRCLECLETFDLSSGTYEPDLNFCPYCSPKEDLEDITIWNDLNYVSEIESNNVDRYVYEMWNERGPMITLVRYHAIETPEYRK